MNLDEILSKEPGGFTADIWLKGRGVHHGINFVADFPREYFVRSRRSRLGERCTKFKFRTWQEVLTHIQNYDPNGTVKPVEIQPMKITFTSGDIMELIEKHLNEHVVKSPVEIETLTVFRDKNGTLSPLEDWDSIEVEVKPKEGVNHEHIR